MKFHDIVSDDKTLISEERRRIDLFTNSFLTKVYVCIFDNPTFSDLR